MKYTTLRRNGPQYTLIENVDSQTETSTTLSVRVGDEVTYSAYFLRTICAGPTDPRWCRRGKVMSVNGDLARVLWDDDTEVHIINTSNLLQSTVRWPKLNSQGTKT